MLKKLLLATAVTAAVFVAHGATAAPTGNPQAYTTVVAIDAGSGILGTGAGVGVGEFDDNGGTGGIAAFKTIASTPTGITIPTLPPFTGDVEASSVYDGVIVGNIFTSNGTSVTTILSCVGSALICDAAGTIGVPVITVGADSFTLDLCTGGSWDTESVGAATINTEHTSTGSPACAPPGAPTGLSATPGDGEVTVAFLPGSAYGATITNYAYSLNGVDYTPLDPAQPGAPAGGPGRKITIAGLTNGTSYSITLKAITSAGSSVDGSAAVVATPVTAATPPDAPTGLLATPGDGQATISFTPGEDYGVAITNYEYSLYGAPPILLDPAQANSPITIEGLTNGTLYFITLRAFNSAGSSGSSVPVAVTPAAPADAPTNLLAEPGDGQVTISFAPGADNGSPITGYRYIKDDGSATSTILGTTGTNPFGIAVDAAGNVYTANTNSYDVSKITPDGTSTIIGLADGEARGIALDADGNVYVNNAIGNISKITPDGVSSILGTRNFTNSFGVVIDAAGNFYVANEVNSVSKTTPDGSSSFLGPTGESPRWIALDDAGNVYTPNYYSNNVSKITPSGTSTILGTTGINPQGIAVDAAGNIYTTNAGSATVSKITPDGTSSILGTTGSNPDGIVIDAAGNVYTANSGDDSVSKITPGGISTTLGTTGFFPIKIALDAAGNVYTANAYSSDVSKIAYTSKATYPATGDTSPITITGLTNGTEYLISLIAVNAGGESVASNSVSVTPEAPTAPDAPTIDSITAGDGEAIITFTPGADNRSPITGYTAYCFGDRLLFGASPTSPITVSGLTNGEAYECLVTATNDIGTSPASLFSAPFTPVAPPDAPQITNIEPGNGQVSISVSVADDGGSPITGYTAYCFGDVFSFGASPTSPITVSGLTNGVSYTCAVTATNDIGDSPASAFSAPVTPVAPPPGC